VSSSDNNNRRAGGFSPERRARFLALREAGLPLAKACVVTPVDPRTVRSWAARGRQPDATLGHANIGITMDRYGHLMPGNEDDAAGLLDAYRWMQIARRGSRSR